MLQGFRSTGSCADDAYTWIPRPSDLTRNTENTVNYRNKRILYYISIRLPFRTESFAIILKKNDLSSVYRGEAMISNLQKEKKKKEKTRAISNGFERSRERKKRSRKRFFTRFARVTVIVSASIVSAGATLWLKTAQTRPGPDPSPPWPGRGGDGAGDKTHP